MPSPRQILDDIARAGADHAKAYSTVGATGHLRFGRVVDGQHSSGVASNVVQSMETVEASSLPVDTVGLSDVPSSEEQPAEQPQSVVEVPVAMGLEHVNEEQQAQPVHVVEHPKKGGRFMKKNKDTDMRA